MGSSVFLTDLAGQTFTQDAAGTLYGCHANFYGGGGFLTTPSQPDLTRHEEHTPYTGGCAAPGTLVATLHGYDSSGVPITNTDGDNHLGCTSGSTQYSACATYDNLDTHLLTATNAKNQTTTYSYDTQQETPEAGFGQWLMSTTDVNGQTTTYQYDALGRLTAIINPGDSVSSPSVTYNYINTCSAGKTTPCLELDTSTRFTVGGPTTTMKQWYDGWGRLVETQTPGPNLFSRVPAIPSLLITYTVYDNMGRATTKSLQYAVAATAGLGYVAPDLNQPRSVTAYDSLGRSLGTATYSTTSTIVTRSSSSYTVAQGVATLSSENNNAYEQTITLDAYNHQSVSYTDGLGRTRFSQVDSGTGNPYSVVRTVGKAYDVVGNTLAVTTYDSTGTAKASYSATYDGLARLLGFNDSDLGSCANTPMPADCSSSTDLAWKYSYDGDGNQLSATDPRNQSIFTTYDAVDRPLCSALTSADASSCQGSTYATFFYDGYSNASTPGATFPTSCVAPSGNYASDPVGRKTAELFVSASGAGNGWRCYGYDQRGQTDQSTLSVTTPDAGTVTQTMNVTYNDGGEVTGLVYPDGETLTSTYDVNGRLHSIYFGTPNSTDPVPFLIGQVSYANAGQITSMAIGGSAAKASIPTPVLSSTTTYDGIQRPLSTSATVAGQTIWQQSRTYDNVGNILGLSATLPAQGGGTATENEAFCYDALSRLVWAGNSGTPSGGDHCMSAPTGSTLSAYAQSYSYDNLDRITSSAAGTYTYGDTNQVHAVTSVSSVPNPYASYDAMGNMTCRNVDTTGVQTCAGSTPTGATMGYDADGQLTNWNAPSGTVGSAHYLYDNAGNRVLTNSSNASATTDTIYFDGYTETVLSGGTTTTTKFYNLNGSRIAVRTSSTLSYVVSDPLGSNTVALNNIGQVMALQHYSPYGTVDYSWGSMPTSFNYAGERLDKQTGLLYDNFRFYDPVVGRFVRSDNVQDNSKGMDPYAYVGDNPETRNDPSGHCWPLCTMLIGAVIGAAISVGTTVISNAVQGKSTSLGEIAQSAVVGAVSGAVAGLAGPEAGPLAKVAVSALSSGAGQMVSNAMSGKPLMDGVGQAALVGGITGGAIEGGGALLKGAATFLKGGADDVAGAISDAGAACGLSFSANTVVTTSKGKQAIGTLKVGDHVQAYDPATKTVSTQAVQQVFVNHDNDLIDVTLAVPAAHIPTKQQQVAVISHGSHAPPVHEEVVHTTQKHPWLTTRGWLRAGQLHLGDQVQQLDGATAIVVELKVIAGTASMYDLTVSNVHTFAVGDGQFVVHNCPNGIGDGGKDIGWSSKVVRDAAKDLDNGATDVTVGSRSEAEELFLRKFQGAGYEQTNISDFYDPEDAKINFGDRKDAFTNLDDWRGEPGQRGSGQWGTYHWDDNPDPDALHNLPHLQIHGFDSGPTIRIFYLN